MGICRRWAYPVVHFYCGGLPQSNLWLARIANRWHACEYSKYSRNNAPCKGNLLWLTLLQWSSTYKLMLFMRTYFFVYRHIENERINLKWLSEKTLVYLKVLMCGVGSFPDWGRGILQESSSAGWISLKPPSLRSLDETSRNPTDRLLPSRPNPTLSPSPPSYSTTSPSNHSPAGHNLEEDSHYCPKKFNF